MKISSFFKINSQKGYTLLFAVIVAVLVLSIAAFILSVSRKEAILASSARDSIYAFYAADSGLECAIENLAALSAPSNSDRKVCNDTEISVAYDPNNGVLNTDYPVYGTSTFSMSNGGGVGTQSGVSSCASTTVTYATIPNGYDGATATSTIVTVTSRGYNIGWNGRDCSITGPRKVERALQYTQYQ